MTQSTGNVNLDTAQKHHEMAAIVSNTNMLRSHKAARGRENQDSLGPGLVHTSRVHRGTSSCNCTVHTYSVPCQNGEADGTPYRNKRASALLDGYLQ